MLLANDNEIVGIGNAHAIFDAARHPRSFLSLDGADHLLTRPADAAYAASMIAAWGPRWLPTRERTGGGVTPPGPVPDGVVVVAESTARPYGQRITAGAHQLSADEPAAIGAADSGPTPYDLMLAGLGAWRRSPASSPSSNRRRPRAKPVSVRFSTRCSTSNFVSR